MLKLVVRKNALGYGNFGHSLINKHYIVRFSLRMRETACSLLPV